MANLNEIVISTPSADFEFVEIIGDAGEDISNLSLLEITNTGAIDDVISFAEQSLGDDGFFLASSPAAEAQYGVTGDLQIADNTFTNSTSTYLLVENFTGASGDDLDTEDDGTLDDPTPWSAIVDQIAFIENDGETTYGTPAFGPTEDGFLPVGAFRDENGDFQTYVFDTVGDEATPEGEPLQATTVSIMEIQGEGHTSPLEGQLVSTTGVVTAVDSNGFYFQDPTGDDNVATSDALFVFTGGEPTVSVGNSITVEGTVSEFFPGGEGTGNLSTTQLSGATVTVDEPSVDLPSATIIGEGGRIPPSENIDDDAFAEFNPTEAGIDFFESLEGMLVTAQEALAVAPTNRFGEIFTVTDNGANATVISDRGTLNISPDDFNPEKVQINSRSGILPDFDFPDVNVGASLGDVTGVIGYSFGNFEVYPTEPFAVTESTLEAETTNITSGEERLTFASYNVLNLDPVVEDVNSIDPTEDDPEGEIDDDLGNGRFTAISEQIVNNLNAPDIIALQEIQDNDGAELTDVGDADVTLQTLVDSIAEAGGPTYEFIDTPGIVPAFIDEDGDLVRPTGGQPGGNIRNAFLYNSDRVDLVEESVQPLTDPQDQATNPDNPFFGGRIPLAATFEFSGEEITLVNNHLSSKGGSSPILGVEQPFEERQEEVEVNGSLDERTVQANAVNDFINNILTDDPNANVVALGDFNEFEFVSPVETILGENLTNLTDTIGENERYSFIFQGNSQSLDHILVSNNLAAQSEFDIAHTNAEFAEPASDHEPLLASVNLTSNTENMAINLNPIGTFTTGVFDEGAAEIVAYDAGTERLFVINSNAVTVDILDVSDPTNPTLVSQIDATEFGDGANSLAVQDGVVAVAIEADTVDGNGQVVFFDTDGNVQNSVEVGILPDMVTFSPDGTKVLVANEGQPNEEYTVDPEGSVSIIDISGGVENLTQENVTNAGFTAFNDQQVALENRGLRIFGPNATVAQDVEPEYITVNADSTTAYVSLQENNAFAVVDLESAEVLDILPLGFKDHSKGLPTLEEFDLNDDIASQFLQTPDGTSEIPLGGLSGLFFEGEADNGNFQFITHPDRGPDLGSRDTDGDGENDVRTFELPDFQPSLYRFELNPENGDITFTETIGLTRADGTPLTGLPNLAGDDSGRQGENADGELLDFDPFGADMEGVVVAEDGTFWTVDEYRPSIYHFEADGTLIDRYVPTGTDPDTTDDVTFGSETLPEAYLSARDNRGFEAIAQDPESGTVYAFIQTPLGNDGTGEFNRDVSDNSQVIRILGINPTDGTPVEEYVYLLEKPAFSEGNIDKIGAATYTGEGKFTVIERDSGTESTSNKVVYEINLSGATNLLAEDAPSLDGTTLEQLSGDELAEAGIRAVSKTEVTNLPSLGFLPSDKPEGIAQLPDGSLAVINDNDFEPENKDTSLGIISFDQSNELDASDEDGINFQNIPSFGMLQPDSIDSFEANGQTFILTANEGDARDYAGFSEEVNLDDLFADGTPITATLSGDQQVPAVTTDASGTATMRLNEAGDALDYEVTVTGLDFGGFGDIETQTDDTGDDVVGMHIHNAARGENGGVVFGVISPAQDDDDRAFTLNDDGSVTITGTWDSDDADGSLSNFVEDINSADFEQDLDLYWNIHTEEFGSGEIRGQLVRGEQEDFLDLNDDNEPDTSTTELASGETIADLLAEDRLGELDFTSVTGDIDGDGLIEQLHNYGGRSFSIFDEFGNLVFDSGDQFEKIIAQQIEDGILPQEAFNNDNDENDFDSRSDAKGPEPEAITVGEVDGTPYAFIGLERVGGIMVYNVSNPTEPEFVQYINNRDFSVQFDTDAEGDPSPTQEQLAQAGDLGPEGFKFIPAEESPNGEPLLAVGNEVSGTTTVYSVAEMVEEPEVPEATNELELSVAGTFTTGIFDEGAAEIVAYDAGTEQLFVINSDATTVDILDVSDPTNPSRVSQIDATQFGDGANSVAVQDGVVAVAIEGEAVDERGQVVFLDTDGNELASVQAGFLPDFVTFTPDGSKVLVANEGEPNEAYTVDPEGSVSIIDISGEVENLTQDNVTEAGFTEFNDQQAELEDNGVRIFGPEASVAEDLEPESVAVSPDSSTAYVALQENNALAVVDLENSEVTDIFALGFKDHSLPENALDASNDDGLNIQTIPSFGMLQPDAIDVFEVDGENFIITPNEGDGRDYDGFSEEANLDDLLADGLLDLNDDNEPDTSTTELASGETIEELLADDRLGKLDFTSATGDNDDDGLIEQLHNFGGRSFSIFNESGELVFDSGDDFERITAELIPDNFNSNNDENDSFDSRSDNKGPEPEAVVTGEVNGDLFAFIGLERVGGIMVYNINNPSEPEFVQYLNNRDFEVEAQLEDGSTNPDVEDLGPEGLEFIPAEDSPSGEPLLAVGNEVSGTTTVYNVDLPQEEGFTLELLHAADQEGGIAAVSDAPRFSAVLNALRDEDLGADGEADNTLTLSSGDAFIPGVFYQGSEGAFGSPGIGDIQIQNELGFQAIAFGNHEFDFGTEVLANLIDGSAEGEILGSDFTGANFPYLSTNLNFSGDENLAPLEVEGGQAPQPNSVTSSTVIDVNGEEIGVVGATTPTLASISSPDGVTASPSPFDSSPTSDQLDALAAEIQTEVDALLDANQDMNKVVLLAHMQQISIEQELAQRLENVDIIVGGGSNTRLFDENDRVRDGDSDQGDYPQFFTNAGGTQTALVNTDGSYKYVGRLVLDFDSEGNIIPDSYDADVSGAFATDAQGVADLNAEDLVDPEVQEIADAIEQEIIAAESNVFGLSDVFLNGNRSGGPLDGVRTQETNLGNLTADANLAAAQEADEEVVLSLKNGGGIRASIGELIVPPGGSEAVRNPNQELVDSEGNLIKPEGGISEVDIDNALSFNNDLALLTLTKEEIVDLLEHGVSAIPEVDGQFPQIGGAEFSFDPELPAGDRIVEASIVDDDGNTVAELVSEGEIAGDATETFRVVTLGFLARPRFDAEGNFTGGGDGYPFPNLNTDPREGEFEDPNVTAQLGDPDVIDRVDFTILSEEGTRTGAAQFKDDGTEQDALAEYLAANFPADDDPNTPVFSQEDTPATEDTRIVNLALDDEPTELASDFNGDDIVNLDDLGIFAAAFGATEEDDDFNASADLTGDGLVNLDDLGIFASEFGLTLG
ncbi:choice-of-anchor I family protein [Dactylococcopsis salina]|uniref:Extracellular nuclease n=1 Tax=Dactylococcopsis salina (strain PCC 8305) TaxID=13035 RepID=K9YYN6_DACS8|nr:choice-of-anchor I family protein [Dactylococcopsis salina]AFZ51430.1 putative extracellular nuclease [Dactylococcopsis salina PCC 8305]